MDAGPLKVPTEDAMLPCLLLSAALTLGQTPAAQDTSSTAAPAPPAPSPPADRWLLMKSLQGTWPGALLDSNRLSLYGWTDLTYNVSSDQHINLPRGFDYRANEPAVQQNWVRFERTVVPSGTTEPTFGFRTSWILPGLDYRFTLPRGIFNEQLTANNGGPNIYGVDPIEFYAEAYFPTVAQGLDIKVGRFPFAGNGKAIALGEDQGFVKVIFDIKTGALLGAHMVGAEVTELIQGYVVAMNLETTEAELMHTVFPHPTLSEMMKEAVLDAYGRVLNV